MLSPRPHLERGHTLSRLSLLLLPHYQHYHVSNPITKKERVGHVQTDRLIDKSINLKFKSERRNDIWHQQSLHSGEDHLVGLSPDKIGDQQKLNNRDKAKYREKSDFESLCSRLQKKKKLLGLKRINVQLWRKFRTAKYKKTDYGKITERGMKTKDRIGAKNINPLTHQTGKG
ncbi:hypothetical protein RUM43_012759 [Polyplax serrata]|uniref:Uncharacterized protein n=1 Tax=Polyplax serrata TaxID=468196 RepID=A0AAN8S792_POLSC